MNHNKSRSLWVVNKIRERYTFIDSLDLMSITEAIFVLSNYFTGVLRYWKCTSKLNSLNGLQIAQIDMQYCLLEMHFRNWIGCKLYRRSTCSIGCFRNSFKLRVKHSWSTMNSISYQLTTIGLFTDFLLFLTLSLPLQSHISR